MILDPNIPHVQPVAIYDPDGTVVNLMRGMPEYLDPVVRRMVDDGALAFDLLGTDWAAVTLPWELPKMEELAGHEYQFLPEDKGD